ncbi:MAG: TIGR00296 family protein [Candidatus Bathyarchaeota archaeon]
MKFSLSLSDGTFLVKLARETVTEYLETKTILEVPENISPILMEKSGVFVTLNSLCEGSKRLRGCIGLPYPTTSLILAVIEAAISASTQDPRFLPVSSQELNRIVFEVSVLTPPELINVNKPSDYPSKIKIGQDGLILERNYHKGLLLPQVPAELNWQPEEFLCQTAMKAGLPADTWLLKGTKVYRFQAIIFEEKTPNGEIVLKRI